MFGPQVRQRLVRIYIWGHPRFERLVAGK
jgi:hypothetical protein